MHLKLSLLALALAGTASLMAPSAAAAPFDKVEVSSQTQLATYQKVYIAPVSISLEEPTASLLAQRRRSAYISGQRPISEDTQTRKSSDLYDDLRRTFAKDFVLVDGPGQDVVTISAEITKLIPSRPTHAERNRSVGSLDYGRSVSAGGVDYTVVMSTGSEPVISIRDSFRASLSDGVPRNSVWHDVDRSFDRFSRQLARFVKAN